MITQGSEKMIEQIISNLASLKLNSCGIAVSGGSDSMALLHILSDWESATKPKLLVASIDHGLRPESKSEVEFVKKICEEKKVEHVSLAPATNLLKTKGNLQDNARSERYKLLKNWAISKNLQCIFIGHTLDDQEENLLMRFFRGSGVDGLVSMEEIVLREELLWIRPLLKLRKEDLRNYLRNNNYSWIDDPSNYDDKSIVDQEKWNSMTGLEKKTPVIPQPKIQQQRMPTQIDNTNGRRGGEGTNGERKLSAHSDTCLLYTSPSPRDKRQSRMPSSA